MERKLLQKVSLMKDSLKTILNMEKASSFLLRKENTPSQTRIFSYKKKSTSANFCKA